MVNGQLQPVLHYIRKIAVSSQDGDLTDAHLLERFARQRDEAAFTALVQRYGPLVLNVCRRVLHHEQDAEDAFQATFLVLARKAGSIKKREVVGNWLYGVALRVALKARENTARRPTQEADLVNLPAAESSPDWIWRDLRPVLDEEVHRLPDRYRVPFVLCYLEGKTNEQAARQIGCPLGTVLSRLARARARLCDRLTRRGVTLSAGLLTTILFQNTASATVPAALAETTVKAALVFWADQAAAVGIVSAKVAALTQGVVRTMFLTKLKTMVAVILAAGMLTAGAGMLAYRAQAREPMDGLKEKTLPQAEGNANGVKVRIEIATPDGKPPEVRDRVEVPAQREGVVLVIGTEIKPGDKVPAEQIITVKVDGEMKKYRRLRIGDTVEEGQLLARVDDRLVRAEVDIKKSKVIASRADLTVTIKTREEAEKRRDIMQQLYKARNASMEEVRGAELTVDKYAAEVVTKDKAVLIAELELKQTQLLLEMHEIRSPVRGVIKAIYKHRGEGVKNLEPVFQIQIAKDKD